MITLNHINRECPGGYKFTKIQENINHLMYMDEIKVLAKRWKQLKTSIQTIRIYKQGIGMEFDIKWYAMLIMKSGKRQIIGGIEQPNQKRCGTLVEKKDYKYLGILKADTIKQAEMKKKRKEKSTSDERESFLKPKYAAAILSKEKHSAVLLVRYSGPFLKWTKKEISRMDQRTKWTWG